MFRPAPLLFECSRALQDRVRNFLDMGILQHEKDADVADGPQDLWRNEAVLVELRAIRDRLVGPPEKPRKQ